MATNLLITQYNNYGNRQYVKSNTLQDYDTPDAAYITNVNFCTGDGLLMKYIANIDDNIEYDYLVEYSGMTTSATIRSRWFIIERRRIRNGQSALTLKRDVLADFSADILKATIFIERGWCLNNNPLIFNQEPLSVNQIKQSEILLKDKTNSAWYVAYLAKNFFGETPADKQISLTQTKNHDLQYGSTQALLEAYPGSTLDTPTAVTYDVKDVTFRFDTGLAESSFGYYRWYVNSNKADGHFVDATSQGGLYFAKDYAAANNYLNNNLLSAETLSAAARKDYNAVDGSKLWAVNGLVARIGTDDATAQYYQMSVTTASDTALASQAGTNLTTTINGLINGAKTAGVFAGTNPSSYPVTAVKKNIVAVWTNITASITGTLKSGAPLAANSPYYVLTWPQSDIQVASSATTQYVCRGSRYGAMLAQQLISQYGSAVIDIQLLPYFAIPGNLDGSYPATYTMSAASVVNFDNTFWAFFVSQPSFDITLNNSEYLFANPADPKLDNITRFARLNSPNYASSFDFSIAKNKGVAAYNVNCTYKPYTPYIHINPVWDGIYGGNFDDARGLICSGDFSIARDTSAWTEYQLANKNYQLMFNRQIDTMDFTNEQQRIKEIVGAAAGAVSAGASAAVFGAVAGGPTGAAIGGVAGGLTSAVGGAVDVAMNDQLRARQREDAQLNFEYNLGNIKARPNTLTRVSAFNANNKVFPFIEVFDCTQTEKTVITNYLKWNGYTINAIGNLKDYISPNINETRIKGHIVFSGIINDTHLYDEINYELGRGILFPSNIGG